MKQEFDNITDIEALSDQIRFQVIFSRYAKRLYHSATRYVNTDDAQDIVQELMIEVWDKRDSLTGNDKGSLNNYLHMRLKFKVFDHYKKKPDQVYWDDALPEIMGLATNHVYEKTRMKELNRVVAKTMSEMRPSEREVFRLRWAEQFTVQETATSLGISSKSVMNRLSNALKQVREKVFEYYNEEPIPEYM